MFGESIFAKVTLVDEALGMSPTDPAIVKEFIASRGPDAQSMAQEIASVGEAEVYDKALTIFPKGEDGAPFWWDYQIKGAFKDICGALHRVPESKSAKLKAYKKIIDGCIFVKNRQIPINIPEGSELGRCERSLRVSGPRGDRTALAASETVPAGSTFEFEVVCLKAELIPVVKEWLDYTQLRGFGQWRNSGKGRSTWEEVNQG